ncbi:MAG: signal peptidase I [Ruminococcus sp.]|nr:signal peptidase I [Ruminococcus sp.]
MAISEKVTIKGIILCIRKVLKKTVSFLTTIIILIAFSVTFLFLAKIKPYVVISGSMEPAIPVQSVCFVNERIPLADIAVGEVISFRMGENKPVTHRVTSISEDKYTTKGDANNIEDATPVTAKNYIGKTVLVIPKVGYFLSFLHTKKGKIIIITLIVLLFILSFIPTKEAETK